MTHVNKQLTDDHFSTPGFYDDYGDYEDYNEENDTGLGLMPDGRVTCFKCGKILSSKNAGVQHFRNLHLVNEPVKCGICKKMFKHKQARAVHMLNFHGVSSKRGNLITASSIKR